MNDDFLDALNGPRGSLDGWLESASEEEVRAAIRRVMAPAEDLRDRFAAKAMQSLIVTMAHVAMNTGVHPGSADISRTAYEFADAMLAAREVQS